MSSQLKELFHIAFDYLNESYDENLIDPRFEQAEFNDDGKTWEIVISYLLRKKVKKVINTAIEEMLEPSYERVYKLIKIDSEKKIKGFYIFNK